MRNMLRASLAMTTTLSLIGPAAAADMTGAEIKEYISGKTLYIEFTAASVAAAGNGVIYYSPDGTALYKTAKGDMWHGKWTIKDNSVCNDWKEAPNNPCTGYDKTGDVISVNNVATKQVRGKVTRTAAGNAEKLVP